MVAFLFKGDGLKLKRFTILKNGFGIIRITCEPLPQASVRKLKRGTVLKSNGWFVKSDKLRNSERPESEKNKQS